jgi:hypothetical protein
VSSAAPTDQAPPQADPDQMPMQPGNSNTPQFRNIKKQLARKEQVTPNKNPNRTKECQKEAILFSCC